MPGWSGIDRPGRGRVDTICIAAPGRESPAPYPGPRAPAPGPRTQSPLPRPTPPMPRPLTADNPSPYRRVSAWLARRAPWLVWVYWALLVVGTHRPVFDPAPPEPMGPLDPVLQPDKALHFVGFGVLMALVVMSGVCGRGRDWAGRCGLSLLLALLYAVADELTQYFVPGREVDWTDILANGLGVLSVYVLAMLPAQRQRVERRPGVAVALVLLAPAIGCLLLSPGVMDWLIRARHDVLGAESSAYPLDYLFHGLVAMIVSVLLIVAWPMASRRPRRAAGLAVAVLLLSAPLIEIAQHYTGRGLEAADARSHIIGVGVALVWWAVGLARDPGLGGEGAFTAREATA